MGFIERPKKTIWTEKDDWNYQRGRIENKSRLGSNDLIESVLSFQIPTYYRSLAIIKKWNNFEPVMIQQIGT